MDYQKAYALLIVKMSDAIDALSKSRVVSWHTEKALKIMKDGLEEAEEIYINAED